MVGDIFLGTTTHSGLRAFFTNNFTNYTPISSLTIGWSKQQPMVGDIFFLGTTTPSGLRALDAGNSIQWLATFFLYALPPFLSLQHFFTNNFTKYTPISSPTIGCSKQHQIFGEIYFGTTAPSGLIALYAQKSSQWLGTFFFFFWHYHPFWT